MQKNYYLLLLDISEIGIVKKYKKYISFYILKIVFDNLHYRLSKVNPGFKYDINSFYSILNDIGRMPFIDDFINKNGMVPLYSKYLQRKYGNNYNQYIRYLNNNSIIYSTSYYNKDECTYYGLAINQEIQKKLEGDYLSTPYCLQSYEQKNIQLVEDNKFVNSIISVKNMQVVEVKIPQNCKAGSYITKEYNKENDRLKHMAPHIKEMASFLKNNLQINYDKAIESINRQFNREYEEAGNDLEKQKHAEYRYQYRLNSCLRIRLGKTKGGLQFTRTKTNGRINTNLTNLAKDIRPFLIGFEKMSYLDLCNSQPVLFNILLKKSHNDDNPKLKAEIDIFRNATLTGQWYELLMQIYNCNRETAKEKWMQIAYSQNNRLNNIKKPFKNKFPEITNIIKKAKEKKHNEFAISLQKIESKIFIDEISKELVNAGIIPYTIHDGFFVPNKKKEKTYQIMANVLQRHLGKVPVISINDSKIFPQQEYDSLHNNL